MDLPIYSDDKLKWINYPQLLDQVTGLTKTDGQPIEPHCFLLTFLTFVEPPKLISDLKLRFNQTKKKRVQENILNLFRDWIKLDASVFEHEEAWWSSDLSPWLLSLYNSRWKGQAHEIGLLFLGPIIDLLWPQWILITCGRMFDKGFSLSHVPRDLFLVLLKYCTTFLKQTMKKRRSDLDQRLQRVHQQLPTKKKKDKESSKPKHKGPPPTLLLDYECREIAEQLTIAEMELCNECTPHSIFYLSCKKNPKFGATVNAMINHFDTVTSWIVMSIVTQTLDKTRAKVLEKFIALLQELWALKNYIGCLEIIAAMSSAPVSRLKSTFLLLPKKVVKVFSHISEELSPNLNYKKLRDMQQQNITEGIPFVPYFGLCLQDLSFISDGIPSTKDEKINWHKNELVYKTLVGCFGLLPYRLVPNDVIQAKLKQLVKTPNNIEYSWSLHVEPRVGGDHRPPRPVEEWTPI